MTSKQGFFDADLSFRNIAEKHSKLSRKIASIFEFLLQQKVTVSAVAETKTVSGRGRVR